MSTHETPCCLQPHVDISTWHCRLVLLGLLWDLVVVVNRIFGKMITDTLSGTFSSSESSTLTGMCFGSFFLQILNVFGGSLLITGTCKGKRSTGLSLGPARSPTSCFISMLIGMPSLAPGAFAVDSATWESVQLGHSSSFSSKSAVPGSSNASLRHAAICIGHIMLIGGIAGGYIIGIMPHGGHCMPNNGC